MPRQRSIAFPALAAGLLCLGVAAAANAQFYQGSTNYAASSSQAFARGLSGSQDQGANIRSFTYSPYVGWGGNYNSGTVATPWSSKYGGWIQPAASVGMQDNIARQQAYYQGSFQNQDLALRRLEVKRATFDEMNYERMNTPPAELVREENRMSRLTRARNTPPDNEIWSGDALNELLVNIQRIEAREGVKGNAPPLDPEVVKHLNVSTTNDSSGSNELFRASNEPDWPIAFSGDNFAAERTRMKADIDGLVKAQLGGKVDNVKVVDARKTMAGMKSKLFGLRFETSFTDYSQGLQFLSKLENSINTLAKPNGKKFIDGTYAAKGSTVMEVISNMTSNGLKFAQATPGFEPYYSAFYQSLVSYEISLSKYVGQYTTEQQLWKK